MPRWQPPVPRHSNLTQTESSRPPPAAMRKIASGPPKPRIGLWKKFTPRGCHPNPRRLMPICAPFSRKLSPNLRPRSVFAQQTHQFTLDTHPIGPEYPGFISRIGGFQRNRNPALAQAFQGCLLFVNQRDDNIARIGRLLLADDDRILIENAGL